MNKQFTITIREYTVKDKLGVGSYGTVYKVYKQNDPHYYVLKQISLFNMDKKQIEDVMGESKLLASIDSHYIVKYYDSFIDNNNLNIVMEYCDSGDLAKYLQINMGIVKRLSEDKIWRYFIEISIGISYLHHKKILHRDLKTLNIFLTKHDGVRIGDLGVAKVLAQDQLTHTFVGTPLYLSPEICEERPYNEKSDIWALGCILYEMATFKHPFDASNQGALILKIMKGKYDPIAREYSSDLKNLLELLLEKNHFKRPSIFDILTLPSVIRRAKSLNMLELILSEKSLQEEKKEIIDQIRSVHEEELKASEAINEKKQKENQAERKDTNNELNSNKAHKIRDEVMNGHSEFEDKKAAAKEKSKANFKPTKSIPNDKKTSKTLNHLEQAQKKIITCGFMQKPQLNKQIIDSRKITQLVKDSVNHVAEKRKKIDFQKKEVSGGIKDVKELRELKEGKGTNTPTTPNISVNAKKIIRDISQGKPMTSLEIKQKQIGHNSSSQKSNSEKTEKLISEFVASGPKGNSDDSYFAAKNKEDAQQQYLKDKARASSHIPVAKVDVKPQSSSSPEKGKVKVPKDQKNNNKTADKKELPNVVGQHISEATSPLDSPKKINKVAGSLPCSPKADKILKFNSPEKAIPAFKKNSNLAKESIQEDEAEHRRVSLCIINNEEVQQKLSELQLKDKEKDPFENKEFVELINEQISKISNTNDSTNTTNGNLIVSSNLEEEEEEYEEEDDEGEAEEDESEKEEEREILKKADENFLRESFSRLNVNKEKYRDELNEMKEKITAKHEHFKNIAIKMLEDKFDIVYSYYQSLSSRVQHELQDEDFEKIKTKFDISSSEFQSVFTNLVYYEMQMQYVEQEIAKQA